MSIAETVKRRELEQKVQSLEAKLTEYILLVEKQDTILQDLIERVQALENRPRVGRPPKESP